MVNIIVARSKNGVIGKNGRIPWKIEGEQRQFREMTTGGAVIFGRRTYEEIGHPLEGRLNIVVTRSASYEGATLKTARSLSEAIALCGDREIFVGGGVRLYEEAIPLAKRLYITEVDLEIEGGDAFFPPFDEDDFTVAVGEPEGNDISYTRTVYTRKQ